MHASSARSNNNAIAASLIVWQHGKVNKRKDPAAAAASWMWWLGGGPHPLFLPSIPTVMVEKSIAWRVTEPSPCELRFLMQVVVTAHPWQVLMGQPALVVLKCWLNLKSCWNLMLTSIWMQKMLAGWVGWQAFVGQPALVEPKCWPDQELKMTGELKFAITGGFPGGATRET